MSKRARGPGGVLATRRSPRVAWTCSAIATFLWFFAVAVTGMHGRLVAHWESAATMLFGSFLAGSSPEGGGAVAFPVFTKALSVPPEVARSFGLSIQAVGMSMAVVSIWMNRRPVHVRAVVIGGVSGTVGLVVSAVLLGDSDEPFWPMRIGTPWVKATFSLLLATTSVLMVRHTRQRHDPHDSAPAWTRRSDVALALVGLLGGAVSSLTGTGSNIVVFLFLVVLVRCAPGVALPSSIAVMAVVSVVGLVVFGVLDRQLFVQVEGDRVAAVGGQVVDLAASQSDLLGLWMAAIPVVVWGAPLGSLVASRVKERQLVLFVALLAAIEVGTTVVLVEELRTDVDLIAYLGVGLFVLPAAMIWLSRNKD